MDIIVKVLYQNLMEDIKKLCEFHLEELIDVIYYSDFFFLIEIKY